MQPTEIEAELSYAYLHAVASRIGAACQAGTRQFDNAGIDATVLIIRDLGTPLTEHVLHVQLKATINRKPEIDGHIPYSLDIEQYDKLRGKSATFERILVVLFLPESEDNWLDHSVNELVLRNCAYWVSLRGAEESNNTRSQTVYIPVKQVFSPDGLLDIFKKLAREEALDYVKP